MNCPLVFCEFYCTQMAPQVLNYQRVHILLESYLHLWMQPMHGVKECTFCEIGKCYEHFLLFITISFAENMTLLILIIMLIIKEY